MERAQEPRADVVRVAQRLRQPGARASLRAKRAIDVALALAMLASLLPLAALMGLLLLAHDDGWLERRERVGRDGRPVRLARFRCPPGGIGRALARLGACELPLLVAVLRGGLSFVGPRALPPGIDLGERRPRWLMAPGLTGPAQRWARGSERASELDDAYVEEWSLLGDLKLLACVRCRSPLTARS